MAPSPPPEGSRELVLRLISGIVLAVLAVVADFAGGWVFKFVVLMLALGVTWEWFTLTGAAGRWAAFAAVVAVWFAIAVQGNISLALYATVVGAFGSALFALFTRGGEGGGWSAGGTFYAALPLAALLWVRPADGGQFAILWLFVVVWLSDIGAFAVGRTFKGPRLAPSISPSKTWSGAVGGLLTSALFGATLAPFLLDATMTQGLVLAVGVGLAAQAGDLLESRIKRRFAVKDSGRLIPGHGGLMDRLDSLAIAAPVFAVLIVIGALADGAS